MIKTIAYRLTGVSRSKRAALNAFFEHLTWIRYEAVAYCRYQWADAGESTSFYDHCRVLTDCRQAAKAARQWPVRAQGSVLQRVHEAYRKLIRTKSRCVANVAVARELAGFLWDAMQVHTPVAKAA